MPAKMDHSIIVTALVEEFQRDADVAGQNGLPPPIMIGA
jgi:hypothetical protein